ncbi:hypothetical protein ACQJBY_026597 [Aegilops geniculata]
MGRHATRRATPGGLASASPCAWTGLRTDHKASAVRLSASPPRVDAVAAATLRWPTMPPCSRAALLLWRVRALPCVQRGHRLEPPPREVAEDGRGSVPRLKGVSLIGEELILNTYPDFGIQNIKRWCSHMMDS